MDLSLLIDDKQFRFIKNHENIHRDLRRDILRYNELLQECKYLQIQYKLIIDLS